MSWFRRDQRSQIESELRESRPLPRPGLIDQISAQIAPERPARVRGRFRVGVAIAVTAALVGATAAFGGYGAAESSATHAVRAVEHVVVTKKPATTKLAQPKPQESTRSVSAANQYQKVTMCHDNHVTIEVGEDAVPAHLAHGDTLGECKN
jgi:hypothetical protein